jgi:hypothetical protein
MVQISSVLIRETRVYPCPDFKLSGSQIANHFVKNHPEIAL